jgi:hypothetical protein
MFLKIWKLIEKRNSILFPYLVILSLFFSVLESGTYEGFVGNSLLIDARMFWILMVISGILVVLSAPRDTATKSFKDPMVNLVLRGNALVFPVIIFVYWILIYAEAKHYSNYVFSTYHIQPALFLNVLLISSYLITIYVIFRSDSKKLRKLKIDINSKLSRIKKEGLQKFIVVILSLALLLAYIIPQIRETFNAVFSADIYLFTHLKATYDEKMRVQWKFYSDYMKFVNDNTSDGSVIVIPPQENPWLTEGNAGLDRYFVYPKHIISGTYDSLPNVDFDYVLIAHGTWLPKDLSRYDWPKVYVPAEKIFYIDPTTLDVTEIIKDFDPKDPANKNVWGLIKVDKNRLNKK